MLVKSEMEWPEFLPLLKDECLFSAGGDPRFEADLTLTAGNGLYVYGTSYFNAADAVVSAMENETVMMPLSLGFPVVFLYHHALELRLKELIFRGNGALRREPSPDLYKKLTGKKGHDLKWLWSEARELLTELDVEPLHSESKDEIKRVGDCLAQLDNKVFVASRYSFGKNGDPVTLPEDTFGRVDLLILREVVGKIRNVLDCYLEQVHEKQQYTGEW